MRVELKEKDSRVRGTGGPSRRGQGEPGAAAPLRLLRQRLWPERGTLTSAAER